MGWQIDRSDPNELELVRAHYLAEQLADEGVFGLFVASFFLVPADYYLAEAKKARDARIVDGASLLCRAAMETALYMYFFAHGNPDERMILWIDPPRGARGKIDVSFEDLRQRIAREKVVTAEQLKALRLIQKHGNERAHTMKILHGKLPNTSLDPLTFNDIVHLQPHELDLDLRNAESILGTLYEAMAERNQPPRRAVRTPQQTP